MGSPSLLIPSLLPQEFVRTKSSICHVKRHSFSNGLIPLHLDSELVILGRYSGTLFSCHDADAASCLYSASHAGEKVMRESGTPARTEHLTLEP